MAELKIKRDIIMEDMKAFLPRLYKYFTAAAKKVLRKMGQYASKVRNHQTVSGRDAEYKRYKKALKEAK